MEKKTKHLILDLSNEWDSFVVVVEWDNGRAKQMLARIEMAKEVYSADDCLAFLSFYDDVNLFERGPWFDEWLAEHRGDGGWESGIAISDDKPQADADQLRTEMTRLCVTEEGFWWVVLPKHSENDMETRFQALTDGRTKELLDMGM